MPQEFWLGIPVKNLERSKSFYTHLGFHISGGPGNTPQMAPLKIGDQNVVVMLAEESVFQSWINHNVSDANKSNEVLLCFDAKSKEHVDELARLAVEAGGQCSHVPSEMDGPMYGCNFTDLDGHRWNALYFPR